MNGYQSGRSPYDYDGASAESPPTSSHGANNTMGEGFGRDDSNGFDKTAPRFDPTDPSEAQTSSLADLKDPIQVHLLTETALSDSKEYEILTQEEVDRLKKQCQTLSQRVDATRANLAIQSKYRDAAISMSKLYAAAGNSEGDLQNDESAREAEKERLVTEKKCEELSRELFNMEKRLIRPQRRLLQHTAGILQLTHRGSKKKMQPSAHVNNGIPGSPESLYTYSNSRDSVGPSTDDAYFDDPSHYQLDPLEILQTRGPNKNMIEIPLKSPVREQANQLRGEIEKAREENVLLIKTIAEMEQKLQVLNVSLRETIVRFNPEVNNGYLEPPSESTAQNSKPGERLRSQIDYLESGLVAVQAEQESFTGVPVSTGNGIGIGITGAGGDHDYIESVLVGLWDRIQTGFAEKKQQKEERRKHRAERGLLDDEDASDDEGIDLSEAYSLTAFSTRVHWLYSQASTLKEQKSVLKRQIKQQRELNNKTDAEKDEEIERRQEELEQTRHLLDRAEKDAMDAQSMLADALQDLEEARSDARSGTRSGAGSSGAAGAELQEHALRIELLEAEIETRDGRIESLEAEAEERNARLEFLEAEVEERSARLESLDADFQARNARIESLEAEVQARSARLESLDADAQARGARTESLETEIQARSARIESLEAEIQGRSTRIESLEAEIRARSARIESLEEEVQTGSDKIESFETIVAGLESENRGAGQRIAELSSQLDGAARDKAAAEEAARAMQQEVEHSRAGLSSKEKELAQRNDEMELLNMTLAELKTEVTIARAELDGAYGSRAERAADVAALKNNAEVVRLTNHVERLKKELAGTVQDLESITKETIGAERERVELEHKLDEALSANSAVELELQRATDRVSKLQDELDSERFKVMPMQGAARPSPGAAMLSEQFRATMREERKRYHEDLKEERLRYRRLEEELNRLKRSQGPGRSPLSPR